MIKSLMSILFIICFNYLAIAFNHSLHSLSTSPIHSVGKPDTEPFHDKKKKNWTKDVWSVIELDQKVNAPLFHPYNDKIPGFDYPNQEIKSALFEVHKGAIKWNLWTIIMRNFFNNKLLLYSPYDPEWENNRDDGFLLYPVSPSEYGTSSEATYETDSTFRENVLNMGLIGQVYYDPYATPLLSWLYPDEDSIIYNPKTGFHEAVYPPDDIVLYQDKDIVAYNIKEKWILDENGKVLDKIITAIAPIIIQKDNNGNDVGERELFWLEYTALVELLTPYYIQLNRYKREEIITLGEFFDRREFFASEISRDSIQVKKVID